MISSSGINPISFRYKKIGLNQWYRRVACMQGYYYIQLYLCVNFCNVSDVVICCRAQSITFKLKPKIATVGTYPWYNIAIGREL